MYVRGDFASAKDYFVHGDDPCFVDGRDVQLGLSRAVVCIVQTTNIHRGFYFNLNLLRTPLAVFQICICSRGMNQPEKQADFAQFQEQTLGWLKLL